MIERWLYHSPLPLPDVPLAHHEAITKEQGNASDALTFYVVLPVLNEHIMRKLDVPGAIYADPICGGFVDVSEYSELASHPLQEVVSNLVFLFGAGWYASVFGFISVLFCVRMYSMAASESQSLASYPIANLASKAMPRSTKSTVSTSPCWSNKRSCATAAHSLPRSFREGAKISVRFVREYQPLCLALAITQSRTKSGSSQGMS